MNPWKALSFRRLLPWLGALPVVAGCGATVPFHPVTPPPSSPLGPGSILVPRSLEDDALLGRVLLDAPENGRSLDELSRPNECIDKLSAKKEDPLVRTFEDAQGLTAGGKARAALGMFGLDEDAQEATHFYYRLDLEKQVTRSATPDYVACCKDKGTCGYGFVSALAYGEAQYATADENTADSSVDIPVSGEGPGFAKVKILHKRYVYGYVAAFVTVTDETKAKAIGILGDPVAVKPVATEQDLPEQGKIRFEQQKIQLTASNRSPAEFAYLFRDGNGEISENEFVRRYEAVVGSAEISKAKRNWNRVWLHYGIGASIAGALAIGVGAYVGLATPQSTEVFAYAPAPSTVPNCNSSTLSLVSGVGYELQCSSRINPGLGEGLAITGGALLGSGLVSFVVYAIRGYDGSTSDHVIGRVAADFYVSKYNRALLHKMIEETKETQERAPPLSGKNDAPTFVITPIVSPGFTGIGGTF